MSVKYVTNDYDTPKNILARPDGYVAYEYKHAQATTSVPGNAVLVDDRYIVKAGTIYPANDATAIGVVLNDYDVTDGDKVMAVAVSGDFVTAKLPAVPAAAAKAVLLGCKFFPVTGVVPAWAAVTKAAYVTGAEEATTKTVAVSFTKNIHFRDGATSEDNWTITAESDTKVSVDSIALSADKLTATFTLKTTTTALVAGSITVLPDASVISIGVAPAAAVAIATVATAG